MCVNEQSKNGGGGINEVYFSVMFLNFEIYIQIKGEEKYIDWELLSVVNNLCLKCISKLEV